MWSLEIGETGPALGEKGEKKRVLKLQGKKKKDQISLSPRTVRRPQEGDTSDSDRKRKEKGEK